MLKATWIHLDELEKYLQEFTKNSSCLNVCCGYSMVGTCRIDNSRESWRTDPGDLFNLTYADNSFDYVYCDPPFNYYTAGDNRFRWQQKLFDICRIALITRRPKVMVHLPSIKHEYVIAESATLALSLLRIDYKQDSSSLT